MDARHGSETWLAGVTASFLVIFAPIETIYSWSFGLVSPYYLVDAIGVGLLIVGVTHSVRARPRARPALLTVGWAWMSANFWRATLARAEYVRAGGELDFDTAELRLAIATTGFAIICTSLGVWLLHQSHGHDSR